jgi:branched-chain amino acid aminotransferase
MNTPSPEQAASREETFPPGTAYMDGRFCPLSEAKISVHVWRRRFFRLEAHLDRFLSSVDKLRLRLPFGREGLRDILIECARRSGLDDAYVEMVCTRGRSPTFSRDPRDAVNRFIAFAIPFGWVADEDQRRRGLNLAIGTVTRIPPQSVDPTIKNYHSLDLVSGMFEAYERGADNVVLVNTRGDIAEGPGFNVFAVKDGALTTPEGGVLQGITRQTALELAAELALPAAEAPLSADALRGADEVFITSTAGGIMAVTRIDGAAIGDGRPGPVTERLTELYWEKHSDPAWTTPVE